LSSFSDLTFFQLARFYNMKMTKKGFTIVELMITVTIMMIMTLVVFFNYNKFNESSLISALAYDMSLTIRQAQVYGIASREAGVNQSVSIGSASSNDFKFAYGVHFELSNPNSFIFFVDTNENGKYDSEVDLHESLQTYSFQRGIKIKELCFVGVPSSSGCNSNGSMKTAGTLDITFLRPDPEAKIKPNNASGAVSFGTIYLQNASNDLFKSVSVYSTGQISVN
jgi:Tfp pilus assembly protein FimT